MLWRFDQLEQRAWHEMALHDATRASAIVLALSDAVAMDRAVETWLQTLATRQPNGRVNLTAVLNDESWSVSLQHSVLDRTALAAAPRMAKENPAAFSTPPEKNIPARAA